MAHIKKVLDTDYSLFILGGMVSRTQQRPFHRRSNPLHTGPFVAQYPLDIILLEPNFVIPSNDQKLLQCLLDHHAKLIPSSDSQYALSNLSNRICEILDNIIVNPSIFESGLDQVRSVGSFKLNTWLNGSCISDLTCVFRTLPTLEAVENLANFVRVQLTSNKSSTEYVNCKIGLESYGFSITSGDYVVQVLITTTPMNLNRINPDIHINSIAQKTALASIRHLRWAEENATHTTVKVLIRILKDFRRRFRGFSHMNSWLIDLLAHYVVMNNPSRQPLPLNHAFRRVLHLLASGFLLPNSTGLIDPCEQGNLRLHSLMSLTEQDEVCCTAQILLRILNHEGFSLLFTHNDIDDVSKGRLMEDSRKLTSDHSNIEWPEPVAMDSQITENGKMEIG
ncbi:Interleukin enhancer-binding factor 2 [Schistosoma japonicum]|nr:Interleukin enhancer-binding factor 2 [Schistosoma japonicum]